jgi:excisionase family DNA binding protein
MQSQALPIPSAFNFAQERMTYHEAAAYLGVSVPFLEADAVHRKHGIPRIKIGRRTYFLKSDLDTWLMAHRVGAENASR